MDNRSAKIDAFLEDNGLCDATRTLVAGDASNRRYERISLDGRDMILMDAPPEKGEDIGPFIQVTEILRQHFLSAPEIYAKDDENGFLLLEDLGDDLYARVLAVDSSQEHLIYENAIDLLVELSKAKKSNVPDYDMPVLVREANLFTEWYLPNVAKKPINYDEYQKLIENTCHGVSMDNSVLVLRDYHAENLIWLPDREGAKRVGLLDYQDALMGHPAYDLVSLLEDARRDVPREVAEDLLERYIKQTGVDNGDFRTAYAILGAQRNLKIVGIFARLAIRDGKPLYLDLLPRVWDHLMHDLKHPVLTELKLWIEKNTPAPTPEVIRQLRNA